MGISHWQMSPAGPCRAKRSYPMRPFDNMVELTLGASSQTSSAMEAKSSKQPGRRWTRVWCQTTRSATLSSPRTTRNSSPEAQSSCRASDPNPPQRSLWRLRRQRRQARRVQHKYQAPAVSAGTTRVPACSAGRLISRTCSFFAPRTRLRPMTLFGPTACPRGCRQATYRV